MKEIINSPGRAVGCERIVKEKLKMISSLIAQIENIFSRSARDFSVSESSKTKNILVFCTACQL